jgi:hypothetical protein
MKRIPFLTALGVIALGLGLASTARALDDATFSESVHLGATMEEINDYYRPYASELREMWHSGAFTREKDYDIRWATNPQRRIYFSIRVSDKRPQRVLSSKHDRSLNGSASNTLSGRLGPPR